MTGASAAARRRRRGSIGRGIGAAVGVAVAVLAVGCVWMLRDVDRQRRALEADVALVSALRGLERAILVLAAPAPGGDGRPVRWRQALEEVRAKAPSSAAARLEDVARLAVRAQEARSRLESVAEPGRREELRRRARSALREASGRIDA